MNISISNIAWNPDENIQIEKLLKKHDIRGIEIAPTKVWENPTQISDKEIKEYKNYWNKKGIEIVAFQSLIFGQPELTVFNSEESRKNLKTYLEKIMALAQKIGAKALVFGSPKNRKYENMTQKKAYKIAEDYFYHIAETAKKYDVFFCIEPNPTEYDTNFLNTSKEALDFTKKINHPNLKIHLDTGAMTSNKEDIVETITNGFEDLVHFHISQPALKPINTKETNHKLIAKTLKKLKYNHWTSIEMRNQERNSETIDKTLTLVKNIYG